jgi:DNA-binding NarL/FixJ family response regulator
MSSIATASPAELWRHIDRNAGDEARDGASVSGDAVNEEGAGKCVLLSDPHDLTRDCMADLLRLASSTWTVQPVCDLREAASCPVDLILMRHDGPIAGGAGLRESLSSLGEVYPGVPVVVLCSIADMNDGFEIIRMGVRGYISAALSVDQIISALRLVMSGGVFVAPSSDIDAALTDGVSQSSSFEAASPAASAAVSDAPPLTLREQEVRLQVLQGKPNKVIAFELGISENTVKVHVSRILKKLRATNRTALACIDVAFPTAVARSAAGHGHSLLGVAPGH